MNIDILSSLAFSIYSNKGVYALFLGAGISKSVGIPTGWEIVIDLINRLAAQNGEQGIQDIETWFENKYEKQVSYSSVLSECVSTSSERVGLLKPYFEKDSKGNEYKPSAAHVCIAKLVKRGYIRLILTTNFDKLLERALSYEGITHQVISNVADISGAVPLVHNTVTIVKINGDYLDSRFRNTTIELDSYPKELQDYLAFIFDNFGIISCGWSAQWDQGIKRILKSVGNRRYSSFFTYVSRCDESLEAIANTCSGRTLEIESADTFFSELNERITALERMDGTHPLSKDIAIARAKKYLSSPIDYIALNDLLESETTRAKSIIDSNIDIQADISADAFMKNIRLGYNATEIIIGIATEVAHWSKDHEIIKILCDSIKRLSQMPKIRSSCTKYALYSYKYTYFIPYYAICFAAIRYENYQLLLAFSNLKVPKFPSGRQQYFLDALHDDENPDVSSLNSFLAKKYCTPQSTIIHQLINGYCTSLCLDENDGNTVFDKMEYFLSLLYMKTVPMELKPWVPSGEFITRRMQNNDFIEYFSEAEKQKDEWPPIKAGLFGGSYSEYNEIKSKTDTILNI